jgi:hypothetical protein
MIFFAVAGPTPGSCSRSDWEAVFRFTAVAGAFAAALLEVAAWPAKTGGASVKSNATDHESVLRIVIISLS